MCVKREHRKNVWLFYSVGECIFLMSVCKFAFMGIVSVQLQRQERRKKKTEIGRFKMIIEPF